MSKSCLTKKSDIKLNFEILISGIMSGKSIQSMLTDPQRMIFYSELGKNKELRERVTESYQLRSFVLIDDLLHVIKESHKKPRVNSFGDVDIGWVALLKAYTNSLQWLIQRNDEIASRKLENQTEVVEVNLVED